MTPPTPQLDRLRRRLSSLIDTATPTGAKSYDALYAEELRIARSLARWAE